MRVVKKSLIVLSLLVLAAHFLREGSFFVVALILASPFLLLVPRSWAGWTLRIVLIAGTLVWTSTALQLMMNRMESGAPWIRMLCILGTVALVTGLSALWVDVKKSPY